MLQNRKTEAYPTKMLAAFVIGFDTGFKGICEKHHNAQKRHKNEYERIFPGILHFTHLRSHFRALYSIVIIAHIP